MIDSLHLLDQINF